MTVWEHLTGYAVADPTEPGEDEDSVEQQLEDLGSMNRERSEESLIRVTISIEK